MKCGVVSCGHPADTQGVPCKDIGKLAADAVYRVCSPTSGTSFLCCEQCYSRAFAGLGLVKQTVAAGTEASE